MIATVLIATHNRARNLRECLENLRSLENPGGDWEILVADNNSSDETARIVHEFAATVEVPVRYIFEGRRGKSFALNSGIQQARGSVIAFTDDDCLPAPGWLRSIVDEFARDPELGVLGGRVELHDPRDQAIAIILCAHRSEFDTRKVLEVASGTNEHGGVIGANMGLRRTAFERIGGFDIYLSVGTKRRAGAEDLDFVYRACRAGVKVSYSPAPLVYHNHGRRTEADVRKLVTGYHRGRGAFYLKHILRGEYAVAKSAYWEVSGHCKRLWSRGMGRAERAWRLKVLGSILSGIKAELLVVGRSRT